MGAGGALCEMRAGAQEGGCAGRVLRQIPFTWAYSGADLPIPVRSLQGEHAHQCPCRLCPVSIGRSPARIPDRVCQSLCTGRLLNPSDCRSLLTVSACANYNKAPFGVGQTASFPHTYTIRRAAELMFSADLLQAVIMLLKSPVLEAAAETLPVKEHI